MSTTALRNLATIAGSVAGNKITVKEGLVEVADLIDAIDVDLSELLIKAISYSNSSASTGTTSASYAVLSSASVVLPVVAGEKVIIIATCSMSTSDSSTLAGFILAQNGTTIGDVIQARDYASTSVGGEARSVTLCKVIDNPPAGNNTYDLRFQRASGSGTLYGRFPQILAFTVKVS